MTHRFGWLPFAALLALASFVQACAMARSVVPAQDSVRFVAFARAAASNGWVPTLADRNDSPVFPAMVALTRGAISAWSGLCGSELPADQWAKSVTWPAALAAVLAVIPLYLILRRAFEGRVALAGAGLFCVMPAIARLGADGLSDSTSLLLVLMAVWVWLAAEDADQTTVQWARWLTSGACLGLACLTRMEAVVLAPAFLVATSWRSDGKPRGMAGVALAAGLLLWFVPYAMLSGKVTPKHSPAFLAALVVPGSASRDVPTGWESSDEADDLPRSIDPRDRSITSRRYGYLAALAKMIRELPEGWGYVAGMLTLAGAWLMPNSRQPVFDRLVRVFLVLYLPASIHFAAGAGYLASRHYLVPAVLTIGWAAIALIQMADWLESKLPAQAKEKTRGLAAWRGAFKIAVFLAVGLACLAPRFKSLRPNRMGYRRAGQWLAERAQPHDRVLDTRQWTALYSGRTTYGADTSREALADPRLKYVVVERLEVDRDSPRAQALRTLIDHLGVEAAGFDNEGNPASPESPATVLVYSWNGNTRQARVTAPRTQATQTSRKKAPVHPPHNQSP